MRYSVKIIQKGFNENDLAYIARVSRGGKYYDKVDEPKTDEQNAQTIKSLFKLGHWSVFEFATVAFEIECPIFMARQLMRYRCASYIERSLRYCEPEEVEEVDQYDELYNCSVASYRDFRHAGERKEEARRVLTLDSPTRFIMQVNLRELLHIFDERLHETAQSETRQLVLMMFCQAVEKFPITLGLWRDANKTKMEGISE